MVFGAIIRLFAGEKDLNVELMSENGFVVLHRNDYFSIILRRKVCL